MGNSSGWSGQQLICCCWATMCVKVTNEIRRPRSVEARSGKAMNVRWWNDLNLIWSHWGAVKEFWSWEWQWKLSWKKLHLVSVLGHWASERIRAGSHASWGNHPGRRGRGLRWEAIGIEKTRFKNCRGNRGWPMGRKDGSRTNFKF